MAIHMPKWDPLLELRSRELDTLAVAGAKPV
jgi:hypothetical protein